jgi:hypothetical protein
MVGTTAASAGRGRRFHYEAPNDLVEFLFREFGKSDRVLGQESLLFCTQAVTILLVFPGANDIKFHVFTFLFSKNL